MEGRVEPEDNARGEVHVRGARGAALKGAKGLLGGALALIITLAVALPAAAADRHVIAGSEWDTESQSFTYAGVGASRPLDERTHLTGQVFTGYLKYGFDEGGRTLTAKTPIVNPSVGLKYDGGSYSIGGSVGADFRRTEKELAGGGTDTDTETGGTLQVEAYRWFPGKKSLGLIVSFSTIGDFFWSRARGKKGVYVTDGGDDIFAGVELVAMGNSDFSAVQAGGFVEAAFKGGLSVLVKAGLKDSDAFDTAGYAGVELYKGF